MDEGMPPKSRGWRYEQEALLVSTKEEIICGFLHDDLRTRQITWWMVE